MNSKILVPRIGTISIKQNIGGETKVEEVVPPIKMEDAPINQYHLYSSSELVRFVGELKMEESKLPRKYKLRNGIVERNSSKKDEIKRTILLRKIKKIETILNRRNGFRKIKFSLSIEELQSLVQYEIKNLSPTILNQSMIRMEQNPIYEIEKGDKMNENRIIQKENFFRVPVYKTSNGNRYRKLNKVVEEEVEFHSWNEENEGELKNKDLMALYLSRRLGRLAKNRFEPLKDISKYHGEDQVIPGIRGMMKYGLIYIRIKDQLIPIKQLGRKVFRTRDKSKNCLSFILNLKGESLKVTPCRYYDPEMNQGKGGYREPRALSYNLIDYENNHIVVIAKKPTLVHLENRVNRLNEEYTFFKNKEGEIIHKPYGLTKQEESFLKSRNNKNKNKKQFDESEIMELFEYLKDDIDGRETVRNMEHDIRNHYQMKYLLQKSSQELFILKLVLEDTREYAEDLLSEEEMARFDLLTLFVRNSNEKAEATKRKITALTNIVSSLHLRIEEEEDIGKYLSDELDEIDKVSHDRESKYYKTHRNYYSQTEGILVPNGNPQTTHKRKSNPPSMERIRILRKRNQKQHEVDDLVKRILSFEEEEKMFWKVNPSKKPEIKREYPWYPIKDILGLDKEDKNIFSLVFKEVEGYLSKAEASFVKDAIKEALMDREEKIIPPSFKLPSYCYPEEEKENPLLKICNSCPNEGECFIEKIKRINSPLTSNKTEKPKVQLRKRTIDRIRGKSPSPRSINKIGEDEYFVREYSKDGKAFSFYAKGNIEALTSYNKIGFTGGRTPTGNTIKFVQEKVDEFSDEYVIVSGLAKGCDTIAHERCIENFGITIAVLPCGFNNIYPKENKKLANQIVEEGGLLISEYKPDTEVSKENLVKRNRIIAGISDKVVIAKGGKGTKHTRRFAAESRKTMIFQPKD